MWLERAQLAALSFLWLAAIFYPLEWARPAWARQRRLRPGFWADVCFFAGQHLLFGAAAVMTIAWAAGRIPPLAGLVAVKAAFVRLPLVVQAVLAVLLGDFLAYWGHRLQHRVDVLWRFHAVHHTTTHLDWLAAHREHPLDGLYTQTWVNLPALTLGLTVDEVMGLVAFRSLWAIFIHSNVRVDLGPLRLLLGGPELHHWHHARDRVAGNYANLGPWVDVLFGTYHRPAERPAALGTDDPHPEGYVALLVHPFLPKRRR